MKLFVVMAVVGVAFGAGCMAGGTGDQPGTGGQGSTGTGGSGQIVSGGGGQGVPGSGGQMVSGSGGAGNGSGSGGAPTTSSGGRSGSGGAGNTTATGGAGSGGAVTSTGGAGTATGGRANTGGAATGGRPGTGGMTSSTGGVKGTIPTTPPANCGNTPINSKPFGCSFAWGRNNPGGSLSSYSYLQFMSNWIGSDVRADGTFPNCAGCTWLTQSVASTNLIPVFYAYFIGFYGHANGLPDGNQSCPNGQSTCQKLTTGGAALIKNNRAKVIQMHAWYAQQVAAVWKNKPLVWLLDGDYVQYATSTQTNPFTYAELAQLTGEIVCAIKAAMPNAVVAINHSAWNADDVTNGFWGAMAAANVYYDLVWTTGQGNANGFLDSGTTATSYNGTTAKYGYLNALTARKIFVDTSFGASAQGDSWSNAPVAQVAARAMEGVIGANVTGTVPSNYQSAISSLASGIGSVCQ